MKPCPALSPIVRGFVALVLAATLLSAPARAEGPSWRPASGQRLDIQLLPPQDLARRVDILALDLFRAPPDQPRQLAARGVAAVCWLAAGVWEGWREDAFAFPQGALGRARPGRPGERWLDPGHAAVLPLLERRLDLCQERGFKGALLAGLDLLAQPGTGFPQGPEALRGFAGKLVAAAHARGLAVGAMTAPEQAAALGTGFDFLMVADCAGAMGACVEAAGAYRAAGKPAWLVAYTNATARMAALCAAAERAQAPLLFKTQTLTGRLHRRCAG